MLSYKSGSYQAGFMDALWCSFLRPGASDFVHLIFDFATKTTFLTFFRRRQNGKAGALWLQPDPASPLSYLLWGSGQVNIASTE